ncbi:EAL domain-containing protein [Rhizobium sp. CG5]|nr:EAL domain-containing protein [Rhizobium sp. CG5]
MEHGEQPDPEEKARIKELTSFWIADTPPEPRFTRFADLAKKLFATEMAFITLVAEEHQSFKACAGLNMTKSPRSESFCTHTIASNDVLVINDSLKDPIFSTVPMVTGPPHIRFYAGAPLITANGYRIGAMCIADPSPRLKFSQEDRDNLAELARLVMEQMELRRADFIKTISANFANATELALISIDGLGRIEFANPAALSLFGYTPNEMIGSPIDIIIPERLRHAHGLGLSRVAQGAEPKLKGKTVEVVALKKDGSEFPIEVALSIWRDQRGLSAGAIIKDISERRERDTRLLRLASQDTLTGLCNRHKFNDLLRAEFSRGAAATVLLLDLDGFKDVNDTHGHGIGDALLQAIGVRLNFALSENATLARFGGDEFAVLLPGTADPLAAGREAVAMIHAFEKPFEIGGQVLDLGVSIGFALAPLHGADEEELVASADFALYRAKQAGGRTSRMFDPTMRNENLARRAQRDELIKALRNNELVLHYQPQIYLDSGRIFGAEALIRWQHPKRGLLLPSTFLPSLEQSSLALEVGWWVLEEACRQSAEWRDAGHSTVKMSINLFPVQFKSPHICQKVREAIKRHGLNPAQLELEITESVALNDDSRSLDVLTNLRNLGVGIAFDDFGTGYASLSSLQRYPLTTLKIDRGFVQDMLTTPRDAAITRALISMSTDLGLETIAEGIESPAQEAALRALGCQAGQGYLYGKPMPARDMETVFAAAASAGPKRRSGSSC